MARLKNFNPNNLILNSDSYKASHWLQYKPGTTRVSSYIEARGPHGDIDYTLFFGLQMYLRDVLSKRVKQRDVDEAAEFLALHGLPFNREGWEHIVNEHGGKLPVRVEALPEGLITPVRTAQVQIVNTDPACYWLPSYLETSMLRAVWYPTTVATLSWANVQMIGAFLDKTDGGREGIEFKLHDFGARGATSREQAGIGGCAHLVASMGSDTMMGAVYARNYYKAEMAGFSIPAAEHSTMTSWGGEEGEIDAMENMLERFPSGLVAVVSDSYDIYRAIEQYWGKDLKEKVLSREDGFLVVRPDSGDPVEVVVKVVEALGAAFGFEETATGYKILHPRVRVIQGDGITRESLREIMEALEKRKLAIGSLAFGMGAGLLQKLDRDTFNYAMKANAAEIDGEWIEVYKDPITSKGSKTSKRGRQVTYREDDGDIVTKPLKRFDENDGSTLLRPVFENGRVLVRENLETVRKRAAKSFAALKGA